MNIVNIRKRARDILGVPEEADENTIRRAYRDLAKKYHPDRDLDDPGLADRFKLIAEAYEILCGGRNAGRYAILRADPDSGDGLPFTPPFNDKSYWKWWMDRFGNL